jgi:hypothetical protein
MTIYTVMQGKHSSFIPCASRIAALRDSAKKSWSTLSTSSVLKVGLLTLLVSLSLGLPLMLLTAFPARAAGQGNSSATSQTSEPLLPFTGVALSQSRAPEAGGFGMDLGSNTYAFSQGGWSWARPGGNFTIEFASSVLSLDSTNVPIMPIAVKNSSIVEHQFSTEVTVASSSCTPSVYFAIRNTTNTNAYDRDIVIAGSLGCSVPSAAIHLQFANPLDLSTSDCDTDNLPNPCSQVLFGNMGLSWEGMSCNYDNSSLVLSCAIGSSFYYDPVALDGSGVHGCSSATSCTVTLTTSDANDVVIVGCSFPK